jgi:hypothetical protein
VTLYVHGKKAGAKITPMTQAMIFSADDGCDIGAPVSPDYGSRGNAFNGTVKGAQLAIAEAAESADHLISPEEAIRIAMARQYGLVPVPNGLSSIAAAALRDD